MRYCQILMKAGFSRQIFEKYSNIKFHEKSVHWEPNCSMRTDGQTDRQIWRNSVDFCNFANALKKGCFALLTLKSEHRYQFHVKAHLKLKLASYEPCSFNPDLRLWKVQNGASHLVKWSLQ